ncbi:hypothetical protein KGQ71_00215, partial [Patescibacteria group bacterium]|nr:hypothetical protein [Patescibacteria group bacterium]
LTLQINKVSNTNLRNDLLPLFSDRTYIEHWLEHWLESYLHLLEGYRIHTIDSLETITVWQDIMADIFFYTYFYRTNNGKRVQIRYSISDYWMGDKDITEEIDPQVEEKLELRSNGWTSKPAFEKKLKRFATLFLHKTETYFKKNNQVVVGDTISTKLIRMTADNLDRNEQIVLTRSALISCELEDLLR